MKYTNKVSLIRFVKFRGHDVLIKRQRGAIAMCYMNGPYRDTRLVNAHRSRILPPQVGHKKNEDYEDWVEYEHLPTHIPDEQWFTYYKTKWEKHKNEV